MLFVCVCVFSSMSTQGAMCVFSFISTWGAIMSQNLQSTTLPDLGHLSVVPRGFHGLDMGYFLTPIYTQSLKGESANLILTPFFVSALISLLSSFPLFLFSLMT